MKKSIQQIVSSQKELLKKAIFQKDRFLATYGKLNTCKTLCLCESLSYWYGNRKQENRNIDVGSCTILPRMSAINRAFELSQRVSADLHSTVGLLVCGKSEKAMVRSRVSGI